MLFKQYVQENEGRYPLLEQIKILSASELMLSNAHEEMYGQFWLDDELCILDTRTMKCRLSQDISFTEESNIIKNRIVLARFPIGGPVAVIVFDDELASIELRSQIANDLLRDIEAWPEDCTDYTARFENWILREESQLCWSLFYGKEEFVISRVPSTTNYGVHPDNYASVCAVAANIIVDGAST